jgi:hypothetical protein
MVSEFLSSELLILNLVARSLAPVFLYGASTVGYTKAVAAEHGGKHQFRKVWNFVN